MNPEVFLLFYAKLPQDLQMQNCSVSAKNVLKVQ